MSSVRVTKVGVDDKVESPSLIIFGLVSGLSHQCRRAAGEATTVGLTLSATTYPGGLKTSLLLW